MATIVNRSGLKSWERNATYTSALEADEIEENREAYEEAGATGVLPSELRLSYLRLLQEEHGVEDDQMDALLSVLPPSEDFDGLVTTMQDLAERGSW